MADALDTRLLRELTPQVVAAMMRRTGGDLAGAEDAVQEALMAAVEQWPLQGRPQNPRAWLLTVAWRRHTDRVRADRARRDRESRLIEDAAPGVEPAPDSERRPTADDTLLLLFMCCHPALTRTSAIALTLRAVGGLTTAEIARAFFVPEPTMAQRISRAKRQLADADVRFDVPDAGERRSRLQSVLQVLYLVFNEGYTTTTGAALQRTDLSAEAIRLTRAVRALVPDEPEVTGLLALMLLTDARRAARTTSTGELVPLDAQDRTQWNRTAIDEGTALTEAAFRCGRVGPFQLQAAIAALHDEAAHVDDTDWAQILGLYGVLERMTGNPMVRLNRAVAVAMVHGPQAGLELLADLDDEPRLARHHRLAAVRAHLLERAGDLGAAREQYHLAAQRTASAPERDYLRLKAARLKASG